MASLECDFRLTNDEYRLWMKCLSRRQAVAEPYNNNDDDGDGGDLLATLSRLMKGGVPSGLRATVWPVILSVSREPLQSRFEQTADKLELMELDLPRTFSRDSNMQSDGFRSMLKATLEAAGPYQQGLSFVASVLLSHVTMMDASRCLKAMLENPLYGLSTLDAEEPRWIAAFDAVFTKQLPRLVRFLQSRMVDVSMLVCKWLRTAFSEVLPDCILVRVWDLYFLHGLDFLFRAAVVLFAQMEDVLLAPENASIAKLMPLINELPSHALARISSPEEFVGRCFELDARARGHIY